MRRLPIVASCAVLFSTTLVAAREGTHPLVVSSWDTRASSILLHYRHGFLSGGGIDIVSAAGSFASTSGKFSAQFGLHYLSFADASEDPTLHGVSASAVGVLALPVLPRYDDGLPHAAVAFYVGSAPTGLFSGRRNDFSVPLLLGAGAPLSPARVVSITPWLELSPGMSLDTRIRAIELSAEDPEQYVDPVTGQVRLDEDDVERILSNAVDLESSFAVGFRAGVDLALHATSVTDVNAMAAVSSVGSAFRGKAVVYAGGGFTFRWDAIVPAVLPADRRLRRERCENIEERFRSCQSSRGWFDGEANSSR